VFYLAGDNAENNQTLLWRKQKD